MYSGLYISTRTSHHSTHDQAAAGLNGKHSATPHWDMLCWNTALDHSCITHHLLSNGQKDRSHQAQTWTGKNLYLVKMTTKDKFLNQHSHHVVLLTSQVRFHGVMVSTQDSESCDPSSNLGGTYKFLLINYSKSNNFNHTNVLNRP